MEAVWSPAGALALGLVLALALVGGPSGEAPPGADRRETPPAAGDRPRARDAGVVIGTLPTGPLNAITDVKGVRVGHATIHQGDAIRTGVTAVLPHAGNLFRERVAAAIEVGNGFGKLVGITQVNELGELETPILLTGTLSVFRAADALVDTLLLHPENRDVRSINPVVGETNDGWLSDIRARPVGPEHVRRALREARGGLPAEGSVGAGTGTVAFGFKGGIGTSSRRTTEEAGGYTVGVLVQSNYGGSLRVDGVPVGDMLAGGDSGAAGRAAPDRDGSVMIVVATDAPLAHRELQRLARRTFLGIARTGSHMSHGSGDYAIAFSTRREGARGTDGALGSRAADGADGVRAANEVVLSALFQAAVEATEEAAINSLFRATSVTGHEGRRAEALPLDRVLDILRRHRRISLDAPAGPPHLGGP